MDLLPGIVGVWFVAILGLPLGTAENLTNWSVSDHDFRWDQLKPSVKCPQILLTSDVVAAPHWAPIVVVVAVRRPEVRTKEFVEPFIG